MSTFVLWLKMFKLAVYIEFQCRRDTLRFLFRLLLDSS